jgi:hypothetical protein
MGIHVALSFAPARAMTVSMFERKRKMETEKARAKVKAWMEEHISKYDYGSSFDLAVDCAYDLELVSAELNDWEIPAYIVDIAENYA